MATWTVPEWLKPLERYLEETGGEPLSTLMAYYGEPAISVLVQRQRDARSLLANTQVRLLSKLRDAGYLVNPAAEAAKAEAAKPVPEEPIVVSLEDDWGKPALDLIREAVVILAAVDPEDPVAGTVGAAFDGRPLLLADRRTLSAFGHGVLSGARAEKNRGTAKAGGEPQGPKGPPLAPEDVE